MDVAGIIGMEFLSRDLTKDLKLTHTHTIFETFVPFFYNLLSKTLQETHEGVVKHDCSCSINDSLKDYQRPSRSKAFTLKGISLCSDST